MPSPTSRTLDIILKFVWKDKETRTAAVIWKKKSGGNQFS